MKKRALKLLPSRAKEIILLTLLIFFVLMLRLPLMAQDTVSSAGVEFAASPSPVSSSQVKKVDGNQPKLKVKPAIIKLNEKPKTLWAIFIAGLLGGFAALLMPCIFPMLPLTVSYFTKTGKGAVSKAMLYGLFIILIYVVLGLAVTIVFGADELNSLSTNGIFNFLFFLMLVAFAASFLGAFELTLPSSWVNKMDQESDRKGLLGIFFMAATLSLVSFSCTGPVIGTLLVQAAISGALLGPAIGMFGFSLALAIPFALFAMFPGWLNALPKSGGWLNSVKVILGFLELAFALKFLSNVDLAYHWHIFDREVFLVLWIVIFGLMGVYLLGKLRLSNDSPLSHVSVQRLFLAIIVLSFTVYLVPGLWGAPLKSISAFLPPMSTQDFDLSNIGGQAALMPDAADNTPHKYSDLFDKPKGFNPFFDYDEALAFAKKVHKPLMIDFTGHACVNCRKMEANVWPDKEVYRTMTQDYVLVQLYVDDKTDLAAGEQTTTAEGRAIKTIGNKWSYLQTHKFQTNSQPFYILLDPDTETTLVEPQGASYDSAEYLKYLESGLAVYRTK